MRYSQLFSMCAALSVGLTGVVQAQTTDPAIPQGVEVFVNGAEQVDVEWVYQNADHCENNADVLITIATPWPTNPEVMEVWVGNAGTNCALGKNRDLVTSSGKALCRPIEIENGVKPGTTPEIPLKTRKLFGTDVDAVPDADGGVDVSLRCENGERWVYILALAAPSQDSNNVDLDIKDPKVARKVGFTIDDILPGEPTNVSTGSGESQITVSWKLPTDVASEDDSTVRVYYDATAKVKTSETCASTLLVAGAAPGDSEVKLTSNPAQGTKYSAAPSAVGLTDVNTQVPVAVAAVDEAGNVGVLSEVKCVAKVETLGFDEVCDMDPECKAGFDTCSTTPWRTGGLAGALALVSCALVFVRRRRRNV